MPSIQAGESFHLRLADLAGTTLYPRMDLYDPSGAWVTYAANYDVAGIRSAAAHTTTTTRAGHVIIETDYEDVTPKEPSGWTKS